MKNVLKWMLGLLSVLSGLTFAEGPLTFLETTKSTDQEICKSSSNVWDLLQLEHESDEEFSLNFGKSASRCPLVS